MRKNLFNGLKLLILLLIATFLSCEEELQNVDVVQQEQSSQEKPLVYHKRVSGNDIPDITNVIEEYIGGKGNSLKINTDLTTKERNYVINWEEVNAITDTLSTTTYAFRLESNGNDPLVFHNLIISKDSLGTVLNPLVAEYVMDAGFFLEWSKDADKLKDFNGEVFYYQLKNTTISKDGKSATLNARGGDGPPCGGISIGGSRGGGGSTTPNIYCWTYVTYGLCETQINHNTGSSYHGSGSCGAGTGSPILGYGTTCSTSPGGGGDNNYNTSKSGISEKEPCGIGGSSQSITPINKLPPGTADYDSFMALLRNSLKLNNEQEFFLASDTELVGQVYGFFKKEKFSTKAKSFGKWVVEFKMLPPRSCGVGHDCVKSIKIMAEGLRKFHGEEGTLMADYFDSLIADFRSFTKADLQGFYDTAKIITQQYNDYMFASIVRGFAEGTAQILGVILFEVGGNAAVALLQKIPVSWVLRGSTLTPFVQNVAKLGIQGTQAHVRIVKTANPLNSSRSLFNALTQNAISKSTQSNGAIVANMGNGNFITFRTVSSTGFPATINLNFPSLFGSTARAIKFTGL